MRPLCGAKTRTGAPCGAKAVKDGKRCRMHGGATPKGITNALKQGIYARVIRPEQQASAAYIRANLGNVDDEIVIVRLQLEATLAAQNAAMVNDQNGLELQKFNDKESTEYSAGPERVYERVDYNAHIDRLTARIASLERMRMELMEAERNKPPADDDEPPQWVISVVPPKVK